MTAAVQTLTQRADYTHKHNTKIGRHGWLRLTPAYSVKVVDEIIATLGGRKRIFDPFCGTATTVLSASYRGHEGITTDINPFLVWLGRAKTADYSMAVIVAARHAGQTALDLVKRGAVQPGSAPALHKIERWWSPAALLFLTMLRAAIDEATEPKSAQRTLLLIAFCRTLIACSNASFNHQSMSFKDGDQIALSLDPDLASLFSQDVGFVLDGAQDNPCGKTSIKLGDARQPGLSVRKPVDIVVTSPPYANRMSYIRELRPYMYWLGFLENAREAGEMDWQAIGGTWGIATSRLSEWTPTSNSFAMPVLDAAIASIAHSDNKNGRLLSTYVSKYFDDMWTHFQAIRPVLSEGAKLHYIIGNSTFYGTLLPVEKIYAAMLAELGFRNVGCRAIRKRNSKKELVEFDVSAEWRG